MEWHSGQDAAEGVHTVLGAMWAHILPPLPPQEGSGFETEREGLSHLAPSGGMLAHDFPLAVCLPPHSALRCRALLRVPRDLLAVMHVHTRGGMHVHFVVHVHVHVYVYMCTCV